MEEARPARVEDLPRLAELAGAAVVEMGRQRGAELLLAGCSGRDPSGLLGAWLQDTSRSVWAGTLDAEIVGLAAGRLPPDQSVGKIDAIYVEPDARGVGVGEAMLERLVAWFSERGCTGVDAVALPGMRESKQFFEESGLVARLIVMHRRLT